MQSTVFPVRPASIFSTPTPSIVSFTPEIMSQVSQVRVAGTRLRSFSRDDFAEIMVGRNPSNVPRTDGGIPGVWPKGVAIPFTLSYDGDTRVATTTISLPAAPPVTITNTISGGPDSDLAGPGALVNVARIFVQVQAAPATTSPTAASVSLSNLMVNGSAFTGSIDLASTSASGGAPTVSSQHLLVGFAPSTSLDISGTMLLTGSFVNSQEASRVDIRLGSDAPPEVTISSPPAELELDTEYPITATMVDTLLDPDPSLDYTVPSGCSLSDAITSLETTGGLTTYTETRSLSCATPGGSRVITVAGADPYSSAQTASTDEFGVPAPEVSPSPSPSPELAESGADSTVTGTAALLAVLLLVAGGAAVAVRRGYSVRRSNQ